MATTPASSLQNSARLSELFRLRLLDTPCEEPFDRLTRFAARLLQAPISLISLVDDQRQFFKSAFGVPAAWALHRQSPVTDSFCQHVVTRGEPLAIEDARRHPLVRDNAVLAALKLRSYLGMPLTTASGATIGSFCVIDRRPRLWTSDDQLTMLELSASVMTEIDRRFAYQQLRALRNRETLLAIGQPHANGHGYARSHSDGGSNSNLTDEARRILGLTGSLTHRQREVFDLLMHGLQTKEIAKQLHLSPRTVEVHRASILHRLQVDSFSQLLRQLLADPDCD
jgi:GAF domain-containing protein/DNA-binding CsgD family transcriptional regulator